jgi:hypothetical protein
MNKLKTLLVAAFCVGWMSCITDDAKKPDGPVAPGQTAETIAADPASLTTMQWMDSVINSGTVLEGTKLEVVFRFKNTGEKPLVIESAQPSCGCTIADKPEKPIMPGQEGQIKAIFNSQGRTGANHKTITVHANTSPSGSHMVEFNVTVVGKTEGPKAAEAKPSTQF